MQAGETIWLILWASIGANAILWTYFHRKAHRNTLPAFATMGGSIPLIATWAWAVPFYSIMIITLVSPSWLRWAMIEVPAWVRNCGAVAVLPTPFLLMWVLSSLGNNFAGAFAAVFGQRLITHGPYRHIRHPLYALECYFLVSIAFATANWIILGYACSGILMIRLVVIPQEEEYLLERFGKSYRAYRKKTGMLLPKLMPAWKSGSRRRRDIGLSSR